MASDTAGDPMGPLKWTRKSTRKASRELRRRKISASPRTVARLLKVSDHDFRSTASAIATPYGIYDVRANHGFVIVSTSHDTAEFAVDNIACWLKSSGTRRYPKIKELLIFCDTGGSNGYRCRMWKHAIQERLCDAFGIAVTVCHYPTGASKWNPIEHHLFSHMSGNWAGVPLRSLEIMLKYIRTTTTQTGLRVQARLNEKKYFTRIKINDHQMAEINIRRHKVLPDWNYTIYPTGSAWNSKPSCSQK